LAGLAANRVFAQPAVPVSQQGVSAGTTPETSARPGNVIGTRMSIALGTRASNIDQSDTRSQVAPNLPTPAVGPDATPADYLRAAQQGCRPAAPVRPSSRSVAQITQALPALGAGD